MLFLIVVGLLGGLVTSVSPCILPVLPVVLAAGAPPLPRSGAAGAPPPSPAGSAHSHRRAPRSRRPVAVVAGLVLSFCASTLLGSFVLGAVGLPEDLLRDVGVGVLAVVGLGMIWRRFGELLARPFARIPGRPVAAGSNGLVVGIGAGLLFVPCAGPVLATIAVVGATHRVGVDAVALTAAFGVGVGVPLLVLALAGDALVRRTGALRRRARQLRVTGGVVMVAAAAAIGLNLTDGLQQAVPGWTVALQSGVESSGPAQARLQEVSAPTPTAAALPSVPIVPAVGPDVPCQENGPTPENCGPAPALAGIRTWLNTPDGRPLDLAALRGHVVLIDFWTYSCINCQRTLPQVEAWSRTYADAGLVVIGVHTPEFAFERVPGNVADQAAALGVDYPVAIDNDYATWNAYGNRYWPGEYLIDAGGIIRHVHHGEGSYDVTERLIRTLLDDARPGQPLPAPTDVADTGSMTFGRTPETYLGYRHPLRVSGPAPARDRSRTYRFPDVLEPDTFALSGPWRAGPQSLTATGDGARLELSYQAAAVYVVLGGSGTVTVESGGVSTTVDVAGPPTLYPVARASGDVRSVLTLTATAGIQAYVVTFG